MRASLQPALHAAARTRLASAARIGNFPARMATAAAAQPITPATNPATALPPNQAPLSERDVERQRRAKQILQTAAAATELRHDWTREEISAIFYQPLMELTYQAVSRHA